MTEADEKKRAARNATLRSRRSKAIGRSAENAVVEYLRDRHISAERRRLTGAEDCGDIGGWSGHVVEVKAESKLDLPGYLSELDREVEAAAAKFRCGQRGVVFVKRKGSLDVSRWYAVQLAGDYVTGELEAGR